jgi:membrane protein involved in colicin uptake
MRTKYYFYKQRGDSIMSLLGMFKKVVEEVEVIVHASEDIARQVGQKALRAAALAYSDAKILAQKSAEDVEKAKARLEEAMATAAKHAEAARVAAEEASKHATAEAERLVNEAKAAAEEAEHRASHVLSVTFSKVEAVVEKVEPKIDTPVTPSVTVDSTAPAESTYKI